MPETHDPKEMHKAMFMGLVMMMNSSAMQQLGKLVNPAAGKAEVDLHGAQMSIDMLMMLQAKSKGNLDKDEEKMLASTITALQMNYFETANAQKPGESQTTAEAEATKDPAEAETQSQTAKSETDSEAGPEAAPKKDLKDPKYHKSYG